MVSYTDKTSVNTKSQQHQTFVSKNNITTSQLVDKRKKTIVQRKLQKTAENSPQATQLRAFQKMANNKQTDQEAQPIQQKANTTGLPDNLKSGIENLSGYSMDDVKVHYNSSKPAQLQAHAYAQGTDIHLASGQERHLPHEAWHVVQQKQGRVQPTMQMKGKVNINDDSGLEKEADVMGMKATQKSSVNNDINVSKKVNQLSKNNSHGQKRTNTFNQNIIQRRKIANIVALKNEVKNQLNKGERQGGSKMNFLSENPQNISSLTHLFTADIFSSSDTEEEKEQQQNDRLKKNKGNKFKEGYYDRIALRISRGAKELTSDVLFWQNDIKDKRAFYHPFVKHVELMGSDLHDRGLGAAKVQYGASMVTYDGDVNDVDLNYMIKPDNRAIEDALVGRSNSLAEKLNKKAKVPFSKQVETLNIEATDRHGSLIEFVHDGLEEAATKGLRKIGLFYDYNEVAIETIALAFLGGIFDLHHENVMTRGGAPILIDADVAVRPKEFEKPSEQSGFNNSEANTGVVNKQLQGGNEKSSYILKYAIDNPEEVTKIIQNVIGNKIGRIVPVATATLQTMHHQYIDCLETDYKNDAKMTLDTVPKMINAGLQKEVGKDKGNIWNTDRVRAFVKNDFDQGQTPHFQYQPSTGYVFFKNKKIWKGDGIKNSMKILKKTLQKAKGNN